METTFFFFFWLSTKKKKKNFTKMCNINAKEFESVWSVYHCLQFQNWRLIYSRQYSLRYCLYPLFVKSINFTWILSQLASFVLLGGLHNYSLFHINVQGHYMYSTANCTSFQLKRDCCLRSQNNGGVTKHAVLPMLTAFSSKEGELWAFWPIFVAFLQRLSN